MLANCNGLAQGFPGETVVRAQRPKVNLACSAAMLKTNATGRVCTAPHEQVTSLGARQGHGQRTLVVMANAAAGRFQAAWRSGVSPTAPAAGPENAMLTTIMAGPDGKSSSLRKLVVEGVDDSPNVQVKFCLKYRTSWGQSVKIIGSHPMLGSWDVNKALQLQWTEGDRWVATIELPAGAVYEYKYVLVDNDGRNTLAWQGGSNSVLAIGDSDEQGVEVQDNWNNAPGASVTSAGQSVTRENKLQMWADEMRQYRAVARSAQYELTRKAEEVQASKAQVARLKMELSMSLKAREELEARLADVEAENLSLRAQVAQSQIAMKSTLEEAIKLLQQEIEEGEEELFGMSEEDMLNALTEAESNGNSSSSSSNGGGWGWGRGLSGSKEADSDVVYSNGNGKSGGTFERFGIRLSGGPSFEAGGGQGQHEQMGFRFGGGSEQQQWQESQRGSGLGGWRSAAEADAGSGAPSSASSRNGGSLFADWRSHFGGSS